MCAVSWRSPSNSGALSSSVPSIKPHIQEVSPESFLLTLNASLVARFAMAAHKGPQRSGAAYTHKEGKAFG